MHSEPVQTNALPLGLDHRRLPPTPSPMLLSNNHPQRHPSTQWASPTLLGILRTPSSSSISGQRNNAGTDQPTTALLRKSKFCRCRSHTCCHTQALNAHAAASKPSVSVSVSLLCYCAAVLLLQCIVLILLNCGVMDSTTHILVDVAAGCHYTVCCVLRVCGTSQHQVMI